MASNAHSLTAVITVKLWSIYRRAPRVYFKGSIQEHSCFVPTPVLTVMKYRHPYKMLTTKKLMV